MGAGSWGGGTRACGEPGSRTAPMARRLQGKLLWELQGEEGLEGLQPLSWPAPRCSLLPDPPLGTWVTACSLPPTRLVAS